MEQIKDDVNDVNDVNNDEINIIEPDYSLEQTKSVAPVEQLENVEQKPTTPENNIPKLEDSELQQATNEFLNKERREQALQEVQAQFHLKGDNKYYFKDYKERLAFRDRGDKLTTAVNDSRSAKAMAIMAEAKGWESIKVSGHPDFKREVWLEAMTRGIQVKGYEPQEQDLKILESRLEKLQKNIVEQEDPTKTSISTTSSGIEKQNKDAVSGKILSFGSADYLHDPKNTKSPEDKSFFVELETKSGNVRTIWGKDLERVISIGQYQVNDEIELKKGLVKNFGDKNLPRTEWVATSEKKAVITKVADAVIEKKINNPVHAEAIKQEINKQLNERQNLPDVKVFDKAVKSRVKNTQQITVDLERTR